MNKETKNMIRNSVGILLILAIVYLGSLGRAQVAKNDTQIKWTIIEEDTLIDKEQVVETKEDIDYTGTTQGERTYEEQLSIEPDYIYYDTIEAQREWDSIDAYMEYWYTYLDTNSDGDIDGAYIDSIDYDMGCGGKVHDTIIEWLEE